MLILRLIQQTIKSLCVCLTLIANFMVYKIFLHRSSCAMCACILLLIASVDSGVRALPVQYYLMVPVIDCLSVVLGNGYLQGACSCSVPLKQGSHLHSQPHTRAGLPLQRWAEQHTSTLAGQGRAELRHKGLSHCGDDRDSTLLGYAHSMGPCHTCNMFSTAG
jgi:hypothetical protein